MEWADLWDLVRGPACRHALQRRPRCSSGCPRGDWAALGGEGGLGCKCSALPTPAGNPWTILVPTDVPLFAKKSSSAVAAVQENTTHYKSVGYHRAGTVLGRDNMSSPGEKQISDGILTPWNTHA